MYDKSSITYLSEFLPVFTFSTTTNLLESLFLTFYWMLHFQCHILLGFLLLDV